MIAKPGKYLITTNNYFFAPDGRQYRAAWGNVVVGSFKEEFGIDNSPQHARWFAKIGNDEKGVLVAGCQIHYACICPNIPQTANLPVSETTQTHKKIIGENYEIEEFNDIHHNRIYIAE